MTDKVGGIDIIIPIYNAYEDLVKCILSVWKHTDLEKNRLILVNDKSPDPRIEPYLFSIAGKNIIIHNSPENGGFSASVNIGMHYSNENDVILLNSDTLVTAGWLDKIRECAYSEENIGTVTPLSNSATLASIPVFGQDNPLPSNVTVDEMAELVESGSFKSYPQITVAVGFCMFIKRKLIKEIGFFDAETFGRGYGEENDFCCRAELMGYKHVLCDNTFVYHKGTASFQNEQKKALAEAHVKILEERYPAGMRNNHLFCMSNPYQYIRDNIMMYLKFHNNKKNILYVLHEDFQDGAGNSVGGTQLHVKDLTMSLKETYNIFVLTKGQKNFKLSCYIGDELYTYVFKDENVNVYPLFRDSKQREMLKNILLAFRIDLVHVHHLASMSLEVYYVANEMNIPIITSIHDFYLLCPTFFLYNINNTFCDGCDTGLCESCLTKRCGIFGGSKYISKWRGEMREAVGLSNALVYPSESAKAVFNKVYPFDMQQEVIGHGLSLVKKMEELPVETLSDFEISYNIEGINLDTCNIVEGWFALKERDNKDVGVLVQILEGDKVVYSTRGNKFSRIDVDEALGGHGKYVYSGFSARIAKEGLPEGKYTIRVCSVLSNNAYVVRQIDNVLLQHERVGAGIRVAFVGGLSDIKGSARAYELITQGQDIEWYVFGNITPTEKLYALEQSNLHKFGAYNREDIMELLEQNKIDVVCILSSCSETFCYTLSEALIAKKVVLGLDIGAVGERIKQMQGGVVMPLTASAEEILEKIREINSNSAWADAHEKVNGFRHKSVQEMANEYTMLYQKMFKVDILKRKAFDTVMIANAYREKDDDRCTI